jgi:3-oxoacyl-[acyl-carrier protein] reductase
VRDLLRADGGGEVVMTSSVAGLIGVGSSIPYCASKAGLNNLTITLARALGPEIRVNAVAPGFIDGEWLQKGLGEAYEPIKAAMQQRSPLGKVCTPDVVAHAILSLVTGPDLVTGHVLPVEGGMLVSG